jgi:hypothetical protein
MGLIMTPDAWATVGAGGVGAFSAIAVAYLTFYLSRRADYAKKLEQDLGVIRRTVAVLEVTLAGIDRRLDRASYSSTIPWTAFNALASEIGSLDLEKIRKIILIESRGRDARAAEKANDSAGASAALSEIEDYSLALKLECIKEMEVLQGVIDAYYQHRTQRLIARFRKRVAAPRTAHDHEPARVEAS